ncbi:DUF1134 domain-containing protein [Sphingomonas sp. LT1P40]
MVMAVPSLMTGPALAQAQQRMQTVDPDTAIDADLDLPQSSIPQEPAYPPPVDEPVDAGAPDSQPYPPQQPGPGTPPAAAAAPDNGLAKPEAPATFDRSRVVSEAEGVFGKGATGLAGLLEDILKDQGEPNAYIAGSEGSGAIVLGLRYGSGRMVHAVEGERKVYWTGPSVGFDVGGDANKVFVLVYNLYDSQELYKRFPAGEGRVYFVGGFSATYLRRGDTVLIPVRLGVGWRAGVNVGYMKFSEKSRWFPF